MTTAFKRELPYGGNALFMGEPDGPLRFIKSLGMEVPTYINPREDLKTQYVNARNVHKSVDYHVPVHMRGPYFPDALADYDPDVNYPLTRTHKVRCGGLKPDGQICQKSAMNRTGFCTNHGGALHPADKLFSSERGVMPSQPHKLNRLQQVEMELIPVSDLDDEEITRMQVRNEDGTFSKRSTVLSQKIIAQMRAEFFERADRFVRENAMKMLETMRDIATSDLNEPQDRIKAATWVAERALGKTPDVLLTNKTDAPFEQLVADVVGGSRADYRATRGQTPSVIEGEVLPDGTAPIVIIDDEIEEDDEVGGELDAAQHELESGQRPQSAGEDQVSQGSVIDSDGDSDDDGVTSIADFQKQKKEAAERIKKQRARRYAARAQGATSLENLAYGVEFVSVKRSNGKVETRLKLISPDDVKVPKTR